MNEENDKEGLAEFQALVSGITPLDQDKRHFRPPSKTKKQLAEKEVQIQADSYFSDVTSHYCQLTAYALVSGRCGRHGSQTSA